MIHVLLFNNLKKCGKTPKIIPTLPKNRKVHAPSHDKSWRDNSGSGASGIPFALAGRHWGGFKTTIHFFRFLVSVYFNSGMVVDGSSCSVILGRVESLTLRRRINRAK
jgi:hypothetical protein